MSQFMVSGVPLIPQSQNMACWYASTQMLIQWRRTRTQSSEEGLVDPSESLPDVARFIANNGITDAQIVGLAQRLGLRRVPPMSPTEEAIERWLRQFGPLWVNGTTHIVVIAGIRPGQLFIHDPWPVNVGRAQWRSRSWYDGFIDTSTASGVLMHLPSLPAWVRQRPNAGGTTYRVKAGDNLSSVSRKFYGTPTRWREIYAANRSVIGTNPNVIRPGQELTIPEK